MKLHINKNNLLVIGLAFSVTGLISSCTKMLDQNTKTVITDPVFWKDSSDLIGGVNYLYQSVPDYNTALEDLYSDFAVDVFGGSFNTISDGSRAVPSSDGRWNSAYAYIRAANIMTNRKKPI